MIACRRTEEYDRNTAGTHHSSYNLSPVESPLQNTLALTSTRGCWYESCFAFCLSAPPPAPCLTERHDECSRRVELAAVSTPLLSHPSPSLSFHFTLPLLFFLVTPLFLCVSLSPLICGFVPFSSSYPLSVSLSLSLFLSVYPFFDLISIPLSPCR